MELKTIGRPPKKIIALAMKVLASNKHPRITSRNKYRVLNVASGYRLLDKGDGFTLMTHQKYNALVDR
ncbi:ParE family toxin-like protein [Vibrio mediterranei]|uniref:ParE family toxin-like protein n=1 Tax=Vibrio mediterranei TaxID=689 RepID=UPI004067A903